MKSSIVLFLAIFVSSCSKQDPLVSLTIPLLSNCVETVEAAKAYFIRQSVDKPYNLDIKTEKFGKVHHRYEGPIGVATLMSTDNWKTLDGGSPQAYLELTANGIFADCAPTSSIAIKLADEPDMTLKSLAHLAQTNGATNIEITSDELVIKFNDGSYDYPF